MGTLSGLKGWVWQSLGSTMIKYHCASPFSAAPSTRQPLGLSSHNGVYCISHLIQPWPSTTQLSGTHNPTPPGWGKGDVTGTVSQSQLQVLGNPWRAHNPVSDKMAYPHSSIKMHCARPMGGYCGWSAECISLEKRIMESQQTMMLAQMNKWWNGLTHAALM